MSTKSASASPRRQERGERRITQLLDAAEAVFSEIGYERTTTNAIAARAGVSPGTLYQFFANKDAIAEALAVRFRAKLEETHERAFAADGAQLSAEDLIDRITDTLVAFSMRNPAFKTVFQGPEAAPLLAKAVGTLHESIVGRVDRLIGLRLPEMAEDRRRRSAEVSVQIFKGILPMVIAAPEAERAEMVAELKRAMLGYVTQLA